MTPDRKKYERIFAQMDKERSSWVGHWNDLATYISPRSYRYSATTYRNDGTKKNTSIVNGTATMALRTATAGMMTGITSPARPWFRLTTSDKNLAEQWDVKLWLSDVEERMREAFVRSNLYNVLPIKYHNMLLYGTSAVMVLEDPDTVFRCYPLPVGSFMLAASAAGRVDTLAREYSYTVRQLVDSFGLDNCTESTQAAYRNSQYEQWVEVKHIICPNVNRDTTKTDGPNKPWLSLYWEKGSTEDKYLRVSGFDSQPFMGPRWTVYGEDIYGESPAMHVLGDVKQLQLEERRKAQALDKLVDPPMTADISLKTARVGLLPGDVTYIANMTNGNPGMRPVYEINPRINEIAVDIQNIENRIKTGLYEHLFLMIAQQEGQMTAREIEERHQEKLLALGPVLERLNDELLDPLIDRVFDIMERNNLLPEPPAALQGHKLNVEYISIMAQAQKAVAVSGIERLFSFAGSLAAGRPDVLDKLDFDQTIDEYAAMTGVSPKIVLADEKVSDIRKQRQQQEQAAQMAAMAAPMQQGAQAAKVLSETDTGGGVNALQMLFGGGQSV